GDVEEELIEEDPVGQFGNLTWKSSDQQKQGSSQGSSNNYAQSSGYAQSGNYAQPSTSNWSWSYHRKVIAETKAAVYTEGLRDQIYVKGRLAKIIRERGLWAAGQGQVGTVNAAGSKWTEKQHSELNDPHKDAKLVQEDLSQLLPVVASSESLDKDS
ncbi:unnamed protein product, partial [Rotaria magnacalcarata]